MKRCRVFADFQKLDAKGRLLLTCQGSREDIESLGIKKGQRLAVTFYADDLDDEERSDDLVVDGEIQYDDQSGNWVGVYSSDNIKHSSDSC